MAEAAPASPQNRTVLATRDVLPRLEDFSPHLNEGFLVRLDAAELRLELVEARDFGSGERLEGRGRGFWLVFRGPRGSVMPQRTYRLEHPALGGLDVFLVPIGLDTRGMYYQAVFNRV
jgi:hypothetical protein